MEPVKGNLDASVQFEDPSRRSVINAIDIDEFEDDVFSGSDTATRKLHITEAEWRFLDTACKLDEQTQAHFFDWWLPSWMVYFLHINRTNPASKRVLLDPETSAPYHETRFGGRSIFLLPSVHPGSHLAKVEKAAMTVLDGTYTAFIVPIGFAFASLLSWNQWYWIPYMDVIAGGVIICDIFFNFHCGFVVVWNYRRKLVMQGDLIARFYIWHGTFMVDVLSIAPWIAELVDLTALDNSRTRSLYVYLFQALRLLRLVRLFLFIKGLFATSSGGLGRKLTGRLPSSVLYFVNLIYSAAVLINLLGCLWFWTTRREGFDSDNIWLASVDGEDLTDASPTRQYVASIFFTMTTITTIGYGDITPKSTVEELVCMVIMFAGVLFFGFVVSSLSSVLQSGSRAARQAAAFRLKFEHVELWMTHRKLPRHLRQQVISYYSDVWVRQEEWKEDELFPELPFTVRTEVADWLVCDILRESEIFRQLSPEALRYIAAHVQPRTVYPGHSLCHQGDEADCMWVLSDGEVALYESGNLVDTLEAPAVLGEYVLLSGHVPHADVRPFSIRARGAITTWEFRLSSMALFAQRHPEAKAVLLPAFLARHRSVRGYNSTWDEEQMSDPHAPHQASSPPEHQASSSPAQTQVPDVARQPPHGDGSAAAWQSRPEQPAPPWSGGHAPRPGPGSDGHRLGSMPHQQQPHQPKLGLSLGRRAVQHSNDIVASVLAVTFERVLGEQSRQSQGQQHASQPLPAHDSDNAASTPAARPLS